jgi:hypothetical protein
MDRETGRYGDTESKKRRSGDEGRGDEEQHRDGGISGYQKMRRQVSKISEYQGLNLML